MVSVNSPEVDAQEPVGHVVVIASAGRPEVLGETVDSLFRQTVPADLVVLSVPSPDDVPERLLDRAGVRVVVSERGSSVQRNNGLLAVGAVPELVTYIDDDAMLADDYFAKLRHYMDRAPDVVALTGLVLADGAVLRRELSRQEAGEILAAATVREETSRDGAVYGCNMTARGRVALAEPFDERLRLYAWQEDTDFGARCRRHGRVVHYYGCVAVHLAVSSGRVDGRVLGFAQVVNPYYMWRKGTKTRDVLLKDWVRYTGSNALKILDRSRPDRAGRLRGNMLGFWEVVRHGGRPEAVENVARRAAPSRGAMIRR